MLIRGILSILAALLALVVFTASVGLGLTQSAWMRDRLRDIIAHEAALALGRQVAVGPIEGNLWSGVTLRGAAVGAEAGRGRQLAATRLRLAYSIPRILRAAGSPLDGVAFVEVDGLEVRVERRRDGSLDLPASRTAQSPSRAPPAIAGPGPRVTLTALSLHYTDHTLRSSLDRPLQASFTNGSLTAQAGWLLQAVQGKRRSPGPLRLEGDLEVSSAPQSLTAHVAAGWDGIDIERLRTLTSARDVIAVSRLRISLRPDALFADGGPPLEAVTGIEASGGRVSLVRDADGDLTVLEQVLEWLPESDEPPVRPRFPVQASLERLTLEDDAPQWTDGPLAFRAQDVRVDLDLGKLFDALDGKRTAPAGELGARFEARLGDLRVAGRLDGDLTTHLALTDLEADTRGKPFARAARLHAQYDLGGLVGADGVGALKTVEANRLWADVTLDESNVLTFLPRLERPPPDPAAEPSSPPRAEIILTDADMTLTARSVRAAGRPLRVRVSRADARLDLAALTHGRRESAGTVDALVGVRLGELEGTVAVAGNVGPGLGFANLAIRQRGARVIWARSGRVDLDCRRLPADPAGAVSLIAVHGLGARLERDRAGRLTLLRDLPAPAPARRPAARGSSFAPRVIIEGGDLVLIDRTPRAPFTSIRASALRADVNLARVQAARLGRTARGLGTLEALLAGQGPALTATARLSADLDRWAEARHVLVRERGREALRVDRARVEFNPAQVLGGRGLGGVERVSVSDVDVNLVREQDGQLRLARLLAGGGSGAPARPRQARAGGPRPTDFRAVVELARVRARLTDHSAPQGPLQLDATGVHGSVHMGRLADVQRGRAAAGLGWARADLALRSPRLRAAARLDAQLDHRLVVADLRADELRDGAWVPAVRLERGAVEYVAAGLFRPRPLEALHDIALHGPDLDLLRLPNGELSLMQAARGLTRQRAAQGPGRDLGALRAGITVSRGRARYVDHSLGGAGPVAVQVVNLEGRAERGHVAALIAGTEPTRPGSLSADVAALWPDAHGRVHVTSDLRRLVSLEGLDVQPREGAEPRLAARHVRAHVRLSDLFDRAVPPERALRSVEVDGLDVRLTRDAAGDINLVRLFVPERDEPHAREEARLLDIIAQLRVTDAHVHYTDLALNRDGPVVVTFEAQAGAADLARALRHGDASDLAGVGSLAGSVQVRLPHGAASATVRSDDLARELRLADLVVTGDETLARGEVRLAAADLGPDMLGGRRLVAARAVDLTYDLGALLADDFPWPAAFHSCRLDHPFADLTRNPDGALDLARLFTGFGDEPGEAAPREGPSADAFTGTLSVHAGEIRFLDRHVENGPVEFELTTVEGRLDAGKLWRARAGAFEPGIGAVGATLRTRSPVESIAASASWDLDGLLTVRQASILQPQEPLPVLNVERIRVEHDAALALAEDADIIAALREVSVESCWVQARRRPDGTLELPRTVEMYLPPDDEPRPPAEPQGFAGGLTARLRADRLSLVYEDLSLGDEPLHLMVSGGAGDVHLGRLAALREGKPAPPAGHAQARVTVQCGDARATGSLSADLGGSVTLADLAVTREDGRRTLIRSAHTTVEFDPAGAFAPEPNLSALRRLALVDTQAEIVIREDGRLELLDWLPQATADPQPRERAFAPEDLTAVVSAQNSHLTFVDRRRGSEGPILARAEAADLNGSIDLGAVWAARNDGVPRDPGHLRADLSFVVIDARPGQADELTAFARVDGDLARRLHLRDLSVVTLMDGARREVVAAREARITGGLAEALAGAPVAEQLREAEVWDLRASILRDERGALGLVGLPAPGEEAQPAPTAQDTLRLAGVVTIHGAHLDYEDRALDLEGGLALGVRDLRGSVDLGAVQRLRDGLPARDAGALRGTLAGRVGEHLVAGEVDTDLARSLEVSRLTVRRMGAQEAVISAERLAARYDLAAILHGEDPLGQVQEVSGEGVEAVIVRAHDGSWELAPGLKAQEPNGERTGGFAGQVRLADCNFEFIDHSVGADAPLHATARNLTAHVDVAALRDMADDGRARDAGTVRADLTLRLGDLTAGAAVDARLGGDLTLTGLDVSAGQGEDAERIAVTHARVRYDLAPILAGEGLAGQVRFVEARDVLARLTREADGDLRLARLVRQALGADDRSETPGETGPWPLPDRVTVQGAQVRYLDLALLEHGPLLVDLRNARADVAFAGEALEEATGVVHADIDLRTPAERVSATLGGRLDEGIALTDLVVTREGQAEEVLRAERIALRAPVVELAQHPQDAASLVRGVELVGLVGTIRRDAEGRITSPEFLSWAPAGERAEGGLKLSGAFETEVVARGVDLTLHDAGLLADEPLAVRVADVGGRVTVRGALGEGAWVDSRGALRGTVQATTADARLTASFETDLARRLSLRGMRGEAADGTQLARADEATLHYDLSAPDRTALGIMRGLTLRNAQVSLGSDERGRLTVAGLPVAQARGAGKGAAVARLTDISGSLEADERGVVRGELRAGAGGDLIAGAVATVMFDPHAGWLDITGRAERVELAPLGRLFVPPDAVEVLDGWAAVTGFAYGHPGDAERGFIWGAQGEITDGCAHLAALGEEPVHVAAPFAAGSEGVRTDGLRFRWADVEGSVTGSMLGLHDPLLALDVEARAARGTRLAGLLPAEARERTRALSLDGGLTLTATVTGPAGNASAQVAAHAAGDTVASVAGVGDVRLAGLDLAASVAGWGEPSLRATVRAHTLALEADAGRDLGAQPLPGAEAPEALDARLDVVMAGRDVGGARLSVPHATVRGVAVTDLRASVRLDDERVELTGLEARALGGDLRGAAVVTLPEEGAPAVEGRVQLTGARLATLADLDAWPDGLSADGSLAAVAMGAFTGADTDWAAHVHVRAPVVNGKRFEVAQAILTGRNDLTRLELAQVADGPGRLWARGTMRPAAEPILDLRLAAAEFDLAKLPVNLNDISLDGVAYLSGHLLGNPSDPDFTGWAQVFNPSLNGYEADAMCAQVSRRGDEARLDHLMVSAGRAVLGVGDVRVTELTLWREGDEGRELAPDGALSGVVHGFGPAGDLAALIGATPDVTGWLHLAGTLGGSARRPTLAGVLGAESVRIGEWFVDEARLPLSLVEDTLAVSEGEARVHGGRLSVTGRVEDLYGAARYRLDADLSGLALENLPPVHRLGMDVAGTAALPHIALWGSRDDAAAGHATFEFSGVRLRSQELEPVTGRFEFGDGLVRVDAADIRTVDNTSRRARAARQGQVAVSATYDMPRGLLDARVRLAGPDDAPLSDEPSPEDLARLPEVGAVLELAAPLVALVEAAREQEGGDMAPPSAAVAREIEKLGLRASGRITGEFHLTGPLDGLSLDTQLSVWNAHLDRKPLPRHIRASFAADLARRLLYDVDAEATDGHQYLSVSGDIALPMGPQEPDGAGESADEAQETRSIALRLDGADIELPMWRHWLPRSLPLGGAATFVLVARGATNAPEVKGSLDIVQPSYAGAQFDMFKLPYIEVSDGAVTVRRARLVRTENTFEGDGESRRVTRDVTMEGSLPWTWAPPWVPPDGDIAFTARLADIDLGFFPPLLDEIARDMDPDAQEAGNGLWSRLEARGAVSATVNVAGTLDAPELRGELTLADGSLLAPGWDRPLEDLQLGVRFLRVGNRNRGIVDNARARWGAAVCSIENAWAHLDHLAARDLGKNEYHVEMKITGDRGMDVAGLDVGKISGAVSFNTLPTEAAPAPAAQTRRHELAFNDLTVQMGDGSVRLDGAALLSDLTLRDAAHSRADIRLVSKGAQLRHGKVLRGRLDGELRVHGAGADDTLDAGDPEPLRVDGALTFDRGEVALGLPEGGPERALRGLPDRFAFPVFDVALNVGHDVSLRGMGVKVPLAAREIARITGTPHAPLVAGGITAREGAVRVPAGIVQVKSLNVDYEFGPPPGILHQTRLPLYLTGTVHAEAERIISEADVPGWGVGEVRIFIVVDGDLPANLKVRTWSEPPLREEQIYALMGTHELGGALATSGSLQDVLSEQALNLLTASFRATIFDPIEEELMRLLGLSELDIEFGFNQQMSVRMGKYLLEDLQVSYQRFIGGGEADRYDMTVSYRLKNKVFVAYTTNERNESRVKLTYNVGF